jgi:hypothetical protein
VARTPFLGRISVSDDPTDAVCHSARSFLGAYPGAPVFGALLCNSLGEMRSPQGACVDENGINQGGGVERMAPVYVI